MLFTVSEGIVEYTQSSTQQPSATSSPVQGSNFHLHSATWSRRVDTDSCEFSLLDSAVK